MSYPPPPSPPSGDVPYGYAPAPPLPGPAPTDAPGPQLGPPSEYRAPVLPPPPRRRSPGPLIAGVVVIVVILVGLAIGGGVLIASRDEGNDGRAGGDEPAGPTVELTDAQRTAALLTIDDVAPGYTQEPEEEAGEDEEPEEVDWEEVIDDPECQATMEELVGSGGELLGGGDPAGTVVRAFEDDTTGRVEHSIAPGTYFVDTLGRMVDGCGGVPIVEPEMGGSMTVRAGDPLAVGDQSIVATITFGVEDTPVGDLELTGTFVAWWRDGTSAAIVISPGADPATGTILPVARAEVERLVRRADEKLAAVIAEA